MHQCGGQGGRPEFVAVRIPFSLLSTSLPTLQSSVNMHRFPEHPFPQTAQTLNRTLQDDVHPWYISAHREHR